MPPNLNNINQWESYVHVRVSIGQSHQKGHEMASKKFIGVLLMGLAGLSLPAVVASTGASAETPAPSTASTGTSIVTEELCTWYMLGAPSIITLAPELDVITGAAPEYVGEEVPVSAAFTDGANLNVYSSGNETPGDRFTFGQCTFYSAPTRPIVTVSIADDAFSATAEGGGVDAPMNFAAITGNEFNVVVDPTCVAPWTVTSAALKTAALSSIITTIETVGIVDDRVTGSNDRCATNLNVSIDIPGAKTPTYPGQRYVWEGPDFTTALSTSTSGA